MTNQEKYGKLAVGQNGELTKTAQIDLNKIDILFSVKGEVSEGRIVLQLLAAKEKSVNGIILPARSGELRAAVVKAHPNSIYKRGDIVLLKSSDFPQGAPAVDFVEGNPLVVLYESFIWYKYDERIED